MTNRRSFLARLFGTVAAAPVAAKALAAAPAPPAAPAPVKLASAGMGDYLPSMFRVPASPLGPSLGGTYCVTMRLPNDQVFTHNWGLDKHVSGPELGAIERFDAQWEELQASCKRPQKVGRGGFGGGFGRGVRR